jgi:hypothetical protein
MEHTLETVSPETLKLLASLREASQKAKSYRELELVIHEHTQVIARSQFNEQAVQLEHRLEQAQKKIVPTVTNP